MVRKAIEIHSSLFSYHHFKFICNFLIPFGLHAGLIEEYDSPARLLENKSSSFARLVAEYSTRSKSNFE